MKQHLIWVFLFCLSISFACTSVSRHDESRLAEAVKTQGDALLLQGDYTAALSRLLDARKMMPDNPYLLNSLALAYMGKGRDDLAVSSLEQALDLKPDYTEALNNLGAAYLRQEKWDMAISAFKKVLDDLLYPTPQFPLSNLGWAYLGKQDYMQAESYFLQALDEKPGFITASHGLARVFLETRQEDKAIKFLTACLQRDPDAAILHADLARVHEAGGRIEKARKSWQKVLQYADENSGLTKTARNRLSAMD
ncbi:MAG: tetratricopeptide repeat protein [Desulfotignum sp.]|nr:tetratricopeptide repeat protein [Desulfotignum sp.]MCF8112464.1 tetratricopeptide repeat protein [Desulfotignum sp.]MCF8124839.1 tetratricopeptide repeat protein [Desulfotignum sp.]